MNDTIHPDGSGGFETGSFREASRKNKNSEKEKIVSFIVPESKTCDVRYAVNKCLNKYSVMQVSDVDGIGNKVGEIDTIHFLDTPEGKDWNNIIEWRKLQKSNK